jgi:hypothetical protein
MKRLPPFGVVHTAAHSAVPRLALGLMLCLAFSLTLGACASSGAPDGTTDRPMRRASSTLISSEEVRASNAANAFELIQAARPGWLRKRGAVSFGRDGGVLVYLDDSRLGGLDVLNSLQLSGIDSIRFMDATTASARFGLSHPHGAIQVVPRRGG